MPLSASSGRLRAGSPEIVNRVCMRAFSRIVSLSLVCDTLLRKNAESLSRIARSLALSPSLSLSLLLSLTIPPLFHYLALTPSLADSSTPYPFLPWFTLTNIHSLLNVLRHWPIHSFSPLPRLQGAFRPRTHFLFFILMSARVRHILNAPRLKLSMIKPGVLFSSPFVNDYDPYKQQRDERICPIQDLVLFLALVVKFEGLTICQFPSNVRPRNVFQEVCMRVCLTPKRTVVYP